MNLQESIRRILREERYLSRPDENTKLEKEIKRVVDLMTKDDEFPKNFYGFAVASYNDNSYLTRKEIEDGHIGNRTITITGLFKKPYTQEDSEAIQRITNRIKPKIKAMFKPFYDEISMGNTSTVDTYIKSLEYFEEYNIYTPYRYK